MINIMELDHERCILGQIFGLLSAGGATIETIRQYIESQGEKNEPRRKNKDLSK
mgnify:FL=1